MNRAGATPVAISYLNGLESVSLLAGEGNDSIVADSAPNIPVSADGGAGDDTFLLSFLSGAIRGGDDDDTVIGNNFGQVYSITGPDAGSITNILVGGFAEVENLIAGSPTTHFRRRVTVGGCDQWSRRTPSMEDSGNNTFELTGPGRQHDVPSQPTRSGAQRRPGDDELAVADGARPRPGKLMASSGRLGELLSSPAARHRESWVERLRAKWGTRPVRRPTHFRRAVQL